MGLHDSLIQLHRTNSKLHNAENGLPFIKHRKQLWIINREICTNYDISRSNFLLHSNKTQKAALSEAWPAILQRHKWLTLLWVYFHTLLPLPLSKKIPLWTNRWANPKPGIRYPKSPKHLSICKNTNDSNRWKQMKAVHITWHAQVQ